MDMPWISKKEYEEQMLAISTAFDFMKKEVEDCKNKETNDFLFIIDEIKKNNLVISELKETIIELSMDNEEMKKVNNQLVEISKKLLEKVKEPESKVSMERYEGVQTEVVEKIQETPPHPEIPPEFVDGYLPSGKPRLNFNEIPIKYNTAEVIKLAAQEKTREKPEVVKYKGVVISEWDDCKCAKCKQIVKMKNPKRGSTARSHYKYIEGKCPICETFLMKPDEENLEEVKK